VNTRDGKTRIPYRKIAYFEASHKKINVRTGDQEFDFYDSIENLLYMVPDYFVRCHRSYLVNTKKIRKINLSEGLIEMDGGAVVLLSRTYKQDFKRLII
jgi:DNA-binding LytR/AlgR family response regulator